MSRTRYLFRLDGKTALVTGCKRGIGRAMAEALAEAGADIIGVSASLETAGSEVEQEVTALGRGFTAYACDFADRGGALRLHRPGQGRLPGHRHPGQQRRHDPAQARGRASRRVLGHGHRGQPQRPVHPEPRVRQGDGGQGRGKIIFTASLLTFQGGITVPGYAASQGGIGR